MKTAHPQSLPPAVSASGGINRSTKASTAAPSSGVKNTHGPGSTACGGSPANGRHGIPVPPAKVHAPAVCVTSSNAVEASNALRLGSAGVGLACRSAERHDIALTAAEFADNAHSPSGGDDSEEGVAACSENFKLLRTLINGMQ